ncbi:MAG: metallophosphoesterase [Clostridia bacterium]|nr:metallophosphoesterase [Clostridia bacterium]
MMNVKSGRRNALRALSVIVAAAMLLAMLPVSVFAADVTAAQAQFATFSDLHYLDEASMGNKDSGFSDAVKTSNVMQIEGILDSALASVKSAGAVKYLLITGDLTYSGEKSAHIALAQKLADFEAATGISVYVINGSSDINNTDASRYIKNEETGEYYWEYADTVTPDEFRSIYADFGYDEADARYYSSGAGACSYAVALPDGYRLIAIDSSIFTYDNTSSGANVAEKGGKINRDLLDWVCGQIEEAKEFGQVPIGMTHCSITEQTYATSVILPGYLTDGWQEIGETLADAGMHFIFTGNTHITDIASVISDNGETLYDAGTCALGYFPNQYRLTTFYPQANGYISAMFEKRECDSAQRVSANGKTFASPFSEASFKEIYGGGAAQFLKNALEPTLRRELSQISDLGLVNYVESLISDYKGTEFSFTKYFDELLHGGLHINNNAILAPENFMAVIDDIADQITDQYIDDPARTIELFEGLVDRFCAIEVSDKPCTKFKSSYGFGTSPKGTMGDVILSAIVYATNGNEDISDDPFMQDVLAKIDDGSLVDSIVSFVKEAFVDEILLNDVLSNIMFNPTTFFVDFNTSQARQMLNMIREYASGEAIRQYLAYYATDETLQLYGQVISEALQLIGLPGVDVISLLSGLIATIADQGVDLTDISIKGLAEKVLSYGVLDKYGKSVAEVEDYLINKYYTDEVRTGFGYQLSKILSSLVIDEDPQFKGDWYVIYNYKGPVEVPATKENLRIPSLVAPSFGSDSSTEFNLSWTTKASIVDTDIEIHAVGEDGALPAFTGEPTEDESIFTQEEYSDREYFALDIGIYGLFPFRIKTVHHEVSISDLEPGTTYFYRVGCADKGWWSDIGSFTTSSADDSAFTFFHVTDTQAPSPALYESGWANLIRQAFARYPDAGFVLHTGDHVDFGDNFNQWQAFFDTASDSLLHTAIMPVSGNHEAYGHDAIVKNFNIDYEGSLYSVDHPGEDLGGFQYTDSGIYYSFDYNNAHFAILNTNDLQSGGKNEGKLSEEQLAWLTADMQQSDADWKFVAMHFSAFSNGDHYDDDDIVGLRSQLVTLMPELDIDVVFSGHDHVYYRTEPLKYNVLDKKIVVDNTCEHDVIYDNGVAIVEAFVNPEGTIYSINGTAGPKHYAGVSAEETKDYFPDAAKSVETNLPSFTAVTIDGNKFTFRSYTVEGDQLREIDSFGILKDANELKRGDADLNGYVNSKDARMVLRYAAKLDKIAGDSFLTSDVNEDGKVNSIDARLILRVAAKLMEFEDPYVHFNSRRTNSIQN